MVVCSVFLLSRTLSHVTVTQPANHEFVDINNGIERNSPFGMAVTFGIYIYRMATENQKLVEKMNLMR